MRLRVLVAVAAIVTSACGVGTAPRSETPEPTTPRTSATTSAAVEEPLPCVPGTEPFTGEAADRFGAEQVMEAYCLLADLAFAQEKTSLALPVPEQRPRDLAGVEAILAPRAVRRWRAAIAGRAQGESSLVDGLTLHDVRRVPRGYQRADDGPYVFGTRVGPATAALDGEVLALTFDLETGLVLEERGDDDGRHSLLPVTRRGTFWLVPDGVDGWLVANWDASFDHGRVRLVSG